MALFKNNRPQLSPRDLQARRYNTAVSSMLLIIVLTIVNIALTIGGQDTYFLFSASIPFYLVARAAILCGFLPDAFYIETLGINPDEASFFPKSYMYKMAAIALVFVIFYVVAWLFARKGKVAWLIVALAVFTIDTISPFVFFEADFSTGVMDLVIHALVIVEFVLGIIAYFKLKDMPPEVVYTAADENTPEDQA